MSSEIYEMALHVCNYIKGISCDKICLCLGKAAEENEDSDDDSDEEDADGDGKLLSLLPWRW